MKKQGTRKGKPPLTKNAQTTSFKRENLPNQVHQLILNHAEENSELKSSMKKRELSASSSRKVMKKGHTTYLAEDHLAEDLLNELKPNSPRDKRRKLKNSEEYSRPSSEKSNHRRASA